MNLLDALTTLVDSARQQPENRHLKQAIRRAEARIEQLRHKRNQRLATSRHLMASLDPQKAKVLMAEKFNQDLLLCERETARVRDRIARLQAP